MPHPVCTYMKLSFSKLSSPFSSDTGLAYPGAFLDYSSSWGWCLKRCLDYRSEEVWYIQCSAPHSDYFFKSEKDHANPRTASSSWAVQYSNTAQHPYPAAMDPCRRQIGGASTRTHHHNLLALCFFYINYIISTIISPSK